MSIHDLDTVFQKKTKQQQNHPHYFSKREKNLKVTKMENDRRYIKV